MAATRDDPAVAALVPRVREVITRGQADADALLTLAQRCRSVAALDTGGVEADLARIDALADAVRA